MKFIKIEKASYQTLHDLMNEYYREGEDADTPQSEIDEFIDLLYGMANEGKIGGRLAEEEGETIGFILWAADTEHFAFSELPGYGTVMEIGVRKQFRMKGYGRRMVAFAEKRFKENSLDKSYVVAYGPAAEFWKKLGYAENGSLAKSELPIFTKAL